MWDQTYGCAKHYMCSIRYYMISFISKPYQIVLDRYILRFYGEIKVEGEGVLIQKRREKEGRKRGKFLIQLFVRLQFW